jgi:hypothetical protein
LHAIPQVVPSHVALPFGGMEHGVHSAPHVDVLLFAAHAPPHA